MKRLLALAACAPLLAACGSSSGSGGGASNASSSDDRDTARLKLQECLRKQGLQPPSRGSGPRQVSASERRKFETAIQGPCKQYAQGAFGEMTADERQELEDQFAKFASCMRKNGVDMPNVQRGEGPVRLGVNPNTPAFKRAAKACEDLRPQRPGGGDRVIGGRPS